MIVVFVSQLLFDISKNNSDSFINRAKKLINRAKSRKFIHLHFQFFFFFCQNDSLFFPRNNTSHGHDDHRRFHRIYRIYE